MYKKNYSLKILVIFSDNLQTKSLKNIIIIFALMRPEFFPRIHGLNADPLEAQKHNVSPKAEYSYGTHEGFFRFARPFRLVRDLKIHEVFYSKDLGRKPRSPLPFGISFFYKK